MIGCLLSSFSAGTPKLPVLPLEIGLDFDTTAEFRICKDSPPSNSVSQARFEGWIEREFSGRVLNDVQSDHFRQSIVIQSEMDVILSVSSPDCKVMPTFFLRGLPRRSLCWLESRFPAIANS